MSGNTKVATQTVRCRIIHSDRLDPKCLQFTQGHLESEDTPYNAPRRASKCNTDKNDTRQKKKMEYMDILLSFVKSQDWSLNISLSLDGLDIHRRHLMADFSRKRVGNAE